MQFRETDEIGENWESEPNFYCTEGTIFAANFAYFCKFQALTIPSAIPAKINSEYFENTKELTGAVPITYCVPPYIIGFSLAIIVWTFAPF